MSILLSFVRGHWPAFVTISLFLVVVAMLLIASQAKTEGHFVYALDDPYIHMAIAKNFSQHGVWGVTRHEFAAATSSIGWTLLLSALYSLFGVHDGTPFLANIGIAIAFLLILAVLLKAFDLSGLTVCIVLVTIIVFTPLHLLVFNGMEHLLHACITVFFLLCAAQLLASPVRNGSKQITRLYLLLSMLIIFTRFEGVLAVTTVGIFLLMRKKFVLAFLTAVLSILPVAVYQALAVSRGWHWLPNPVLIRAGLSDVTPTTSTEPHDVWLSKIFSVIMQYPAAAIRNIEHAPELIVLVAAAAIVSGWIVARRIAVPDESRWFVLLFLVMALMHLFIGKVGHFYRYEAYLIVTGLTAIGSAIGRSFLSTTVEAWKSWTRVRKATAVVAVVAILYFPTVRAISSTALLPQAAKNIYEQQYQMAMFVKQFYQGSVVALNDIGAVNYYADIHCFDLVGLANLDVLKRKIAGVYTTEEISKLAQARNTQIAIVYDHWFGRGRTGRLPSHWKKIGQWTIRDNVVAGGETVSFYSVDPAHEQTLIRNLREYSSKLPPDVIQTGLYTLVGQNESP